MNTRALLTSVAALQATITLTSSALAQNEYVYPQPINLILNAPDRKTKLIADPDPVVIGEFGNNMIFSAKVSATVRKLFFKPMRAKDRSGIDFAIPPDQIGSKKYPLKVGRVIKGAIDNYVYGEQSGISAVGVAFFHEKGNGIHRAGSTNKSSSITFIKKTDTDPTGQDPEKMASALCILDYEGKFPVPSTKAYTFPYLLFAAPDAKKGKELWLSDGSAAGTKVFADINPTTTDTAGPRGKIIKVGNSSDIQPISAFYPDSSPAYGHQAYFSAYNGSGYDVYHVTSNPGGTSRQPRAFIEPLFETKFGFNLGLARPESLSANSDGIMFTLPGTGGLHLWGYESDGAGAVPRDFTNETGITLPANAEFRPGFRFGENLGYFFSGVGNAGREPFEASFSNGAPFLTALGNLHPTGNSNPRNFTTAGNQCFFVATPDGVNEHLYIANGLPSGTFDLGAFTGIRDITPVMDFDTSNREVGPYVYFVANDNTGTPILWAVDQDADFAPFQVRTAQNNTIKNPTSLKKLVGNGFYYLFFVCDGTGTEHATYTPARSNTPLPIQRQVWYTGYDLGL